MNSIIRLIPLEDCDREQFIIGNQEAFFECNVSL